MRCSSLPRIFQCPQSRHKPEGIMIDQTSDAAEMGTLVHKVIADYIRGYEVDWNAYTVEVKYLVNNGIKFYQMLVDDYGLTLRSIEEPIEKGSLTGTPDLVMTSEDGDLYVIDWKTGRVQRDYMRQGQGYVSCLADEGYFIIADLRTGEYEVSKYTQENIKAFRKELAKVAKSEAYNPSEACEFCPRSHECDARGVLVRSHIKDLLSLDGVVELTPALISDAETQVGIIKRIIKNYDDAKKMLVAEHGEITLSDGRVMSIEDNERETIVLNKQLLDNLPDVIGVRDIDTALEQIGEITISKSAITNAIKANKMKGEKIGELIESKMEKMRNLGATKTITISKITKKKGEK